MDKQNLNFNKMDKFIRILALVTEILLLLDKDGDGVIDILQKNKETIQEDKKRQTQIDG